uniref:Uncharacterized protein n=1 Tax=Anguilla anguilla TaxID=7936 RepID=A0A0E9UXI2_ANGAN
MNTQPYHINSVNVINRDKLTQTQCTKLIK